MRGFFIYLQEMKKGVVSLLISLLLSGNISAGVSDSLKAALSGTNDPYQRVEVYIALSTAEIFTDISLSRKYAEEALEIAKLSGNDKLKGRAMFQMGLVAAEQQVFDSVIYYQEMARLLLAQTDNNLLMAKSYNETGIALEYLGSYQLSVQNYFKALRLFEQLGESKGVANELTNIGIVFLFQKQYKKAEEYFTKSLEICRKTGYKDGEINAINNITISMLEQHQYEQALANYQYILQYDLGQSNKKNIAGSYNNIGEVYLAMGRIDEAIVNFHKSEKYKTESQHYVGLVSCFNNLAKAYTAKKNYVLAEKYLAKALDISIRYNYRNRLQDCYESHYTYYKTKNDHKNALAYYKRFIEVRDSVKKSETDIELSKMLAQYDLEKVNKELGIQHQIVKKETQLNKVYLISGFLFLVTTFILFFSLVSVRRFNRRLTDQSNRITKQNELLTNKNKELEKARQIAEEATKAKSQFLSMMSHEIRTPLNAIIGIVNVMADDKEDKNNERAMMLKKSSEHLLSLVNDVLDLNKLEAGKVELENISFDLRRIIFDLKEMFERGAQEKSLTLKVDFDSRIPAKLMGDPVRLNQVLTNLVSNAVKFTHHGGIHINCRLQQRTEQKSHILFEVADTGIGIPLHKQEEIFDSFTQADTATTRRYGGSGLGLSISRKILQLLGSDLQLNSKTGSGSVFYFSIEFYESGLNEKKESNNTKPLMEKLKGVNVLVAEDNPMNVYVMKQFMLKWGVNMETAVNGLEVLQKLNEHSFDLVLMDIHMPLMDGMEATRKIRMQPKYQSLPIIAITATAEDDVRKEILQAGMNDYVMKPFKPDELIEKMTNYIA